MAADLQFSFGEGDVLDAGDEGQRLAVGEVLRLLAQAAPLSGILQLILGNMHINHESRKVVFNSILTSIYSESCYYGFPFEYNTQRKLLLRPKLCKLSQAIESPVPPSRLTSPGLV